MILYVFLTKKNVLIKEMGKWENINKKLNNVLISSLGLNYNNIPCSVLDNKTNYRSYNESLPKDFNYPLIKKNFFQKLQNFMNTLQSKMILEKILYNLTFIVLIVVILSKVAFKRLISLEAQKI